MSSLQNRELQDLLQIMDLVAKYEASDDALWGCLATSLDIV